MSRGINPFADDPNKQAAQEYHQAQGATGDAEKQYRDEAGQSAERVRNRAAQAQQEEQRLKNEHAAGAGASTANAAHANAAQINRSDQDFRQGQLSLAQQLQDQAAGRGPSLAQLQLQQATNRNLALLMGAQAAARGGGSAAGQQRNIALAGTQANQQAAADSAQLRMQEQMAARQQLAGVLGGARSQDIGVNSAQAGLNQQTNLANAGFQQQTGLFNASQTQQAGEFNAAQQNDLQKQQNDLVQKYEQLGLSAEQALKQAQDDMNARILQERLNEEQIALGRYNTDTGQTGPQTPLSNYVPSFGQAIGTGISAGVGGSGGTSSDINAKTDIRDAGSGFTNYSKDPGMSKGGTYGLSKGSGPGGGGGGGPSGGSPLGALLRRAAGGSVVEEGAEFLNGGGNAIHVAEGGSEMHSGIGDLSKLRPESGFIQPMLGSGMELKTDIQPTGGVSGFLDRFPAQPDRLGLPSDQGQQLAMSDERSKEDVGPVGKGPMYKMYEDYQRNAENRWRQQRGDLDVDQGHKKPPGTWRQDQPKDADVNIHDWLFWKEPIEPRKETHSYVMSDERSKKEIEVWRDRAQRAEASSEKLLSSLLPPMPKGRTPTVAEPREFNINPYAGRSDWDMLKENIGLAPPPSNDIDAFLDSVPPYTYRYKAPEQFGEGRRLGPMAQDLERTELGQGLVHDTPEGKKVEIGGLAAAALAAASDNNKRIRQLEAGTSTPAAKHMDPYGARTEAEKEALDREEGPEDMIDLEGREALIKELVRLADERRKREE